MSTAVLVEWVFKPKAWRAKLYDELVVTMIMTPGISDKLYCIKEEREPVCLISHQTYERSQGGLTYFGAVRCF